MNNQVDQKEIFKIISPVIADLLGIDVSNMSIESSFDSLGADSLDMLEITMKVEEIYSIEIPDEQAATIKTVKQLIEIIQAAQRVG